MAGISPQKALYKRLFWRFFKFKRCTLRGAPLKFKKIEFYPYFFPEITVLFKQTEI